jgi:hypothetical protein
MQHKEAILLSDVYSCFGTGEKNRKPYGKKKELVKVVAWHGEVLIVEGKTGNRFSVTKEEVFIHEQKT